METPTAADVSRKPLTLVAQPPELPHLELAHRRPTAEENRHTLVAIPPRIAKLGVVEHCKVPRKVLDHLDHTCQRPHAPAPYGTLAGLLPSSPNHFRILADKLRVICISTSLPPPSAQWPVRSTRKERLGKRNGSRSPKARARSRPISHRRAWARGRTSRPLARARACGASKAKSRAGMPRQS